MPETTIIIILVVSGALLLGLSILTCLQIAKRRSRSGAALIFLLRLTVLGVLSALVWQIFWNFDRAPTPDSDRKQPKKLLVLQDRSASMSFRSGDGARHDQAEATFARLQKLAADFDTPIEVERLYFGGNVVPEDLADQLRTDSTQLAVALRRAFSLFRLQGLLVISDGAATDGPPPPYLIDWARNRRVPMFAVGTVGGSGKDVVIEEFQVTRTNPDQLTVRVSAFGGIEGPLTLELLIDDELVERREIQAGESQTVRFDTPDVDEGWHATAVRVVPVADEISTRNNLQLAVFQIVAPRRLLLVYDTPKLEIKHLARYLRQLHGPERVQTLPAASPELAGLRPADYLLAIICDVAPERLPPPFLQLLQKRQLPLLLLSGRNLNKWPQAGLPGFPIQRYVGTRNLAKNKRAAARIVVAATNQQPAFRRLQLASLRLNIFDLAQPAPQAEAVFVLKSGEQEWPLLICDSLEQPRQLVLLSDTTWRWGMHPARRVRSDYNAFWRVVMNWLVGNPNQDFELKLEFPKTTPTAPGLRTRITHMDPNVTPVLQDVRLDLRRAKQEVRLTPELADNAWVASWSEAVERPAIIWFQARATAATRQIRSRKRPRLLPVESREFLDTRTHPETLQAIVADPNSDYADATAADPVLQRLLQHFEGPADPLLVRRRHPYRELIFAGIIVLLISVEWLLERNLKERRS